MALTPEQMRATCDAYTAAYRANDRAALLVLFAEDCEWTDPVGTPTHYGREGVGAFWDGARALADAIVLEPKDITICGNEACMQFEIHATIGDNTMIMDAVDIFVFDDDAKIKTGKAYWDMTKAR
jgi:limonene-1,2-epoxide hydrolase